MVTSNTRSESGQKSVAAPYRLSKEIGRSRIKFRLGVCFRFSFRFRYYFFFLCVGVLRNRREDVVGLQKERGLSRVLRSRYVGPGKAKSKAKAKARQGKARQNNCTIEHSDPLACLSVCLSACTTCFLSSFVQPFCRRVVISAKKTQSQGGTRPRTRNARTKKTRIICSRWVSERERRGSLKGIDCFGSRFHTRICHNARYDRSNA